MTDKVFVDTNILVYAHDRDSGAKHQRASKVIRELWHAKIGVVSTQVLQELYVTVRRKARPPLDMKEARQLIADYLTWSVVVNDGASLIHAIEFEERFQLSFWDALIVQAATRSNATLLYSEDFNHGQQYGGVRVENPLLMATEA